MPHKQGSQEARLTMHGEAQQALQVSRYAKASGPDLIFELMA